MGDTFKQMVEIFSININDTGNRSEVMIDEHDMYRNTEKEQYLQYKSVAYIFGTIIFLSNLTVVISSGLILKKGQQPKSTYLLLGNVSLADTIIGLSIIFGAFVDIPKSSDSLCIIQIGMLVCPAMVSIFSVGLIAIDRYIYIIHGLYYQRWCNTTRVRIGILCVWMLGITLAFLPATGWTNTELKSARCYYVALFPGALILLNSLLSIVPIILVAVLYSIILIRALKNVREINSTTKRIAKNNSNDEPTLRIYRGNGNVNKTINSVKVSRKNNDVRIKRSNSFNVNHNAKNEKQKIGNCEKSKSEDDLNVANKPRMEFNDIKKQNRITDYQSDISIFTVSSSVPDLNCVTDQKKSSKCLTKHIINCSHFKKKPKVNVPNKWRAVIIVMLTSGSFIVTWMPLFITAIFFVFCQEKVTNPKCIEIRMMLAGPIAVLAFLNSILNPLIYAWWHKGFQRTLLTIFRKHVYKYFSKESDI